MKKETLAIHAGYETDPTTKSVAVPIFQTVAYEFDNAQHGADLFDLAVPGNIYSRIMNPTNDVLEQRVAAMEGGLAGLAVASGMAAINYAVLTIAKAGDNIISTPQLYGGTYTLFAHPGNRVHRIVFSCHTEDRHRVRGVWFQNTEFQVHRRCGVPCLRETHENQVDAQGRKL